MTALVETLATYISGPDWYKGWKVRTKIKWAPRGKSKPIELSFELPKAKVKWSHIFHHSELEQAQVLERTLISLFESLEDYDKAM